MVRLVLDTKAERINSSTSVQAITRTPVVESLLIKEAVVKTSHFMPLSEAANLLGYTELTLIQKRKKGISISLIDGTILTLNTVDVPDGKRITVLFIRAEVEAAVKRINEQKERFITQGQMVSELASRGMILVRDDIYGLFRFYGNPLKIKVKGKIHRIELKTAKGGKKTTDYQRYLERSEFELLAQWLEKRQQNQKLPKGYIWLKEANAQFGLKEGTLKRRAFLGILPAKKRNGQYVITEDEFERLKLEFNLKKAPEGSITLRDSLHSYGYGEEWLRERVVEKDGKVSFKFSCHDGTEKFIPVIRDRHGKYCVSDSDFNVFRQEEELFRGNKVFCDLRFVAETTGLSLLTIRESIHNSIMVLNVPNSEPVRIKSFKKGKKCFIRKVDLINYLKQRDGIDLSKLTCDAVFARYVLCSDYGIGVNVCEVDEMKLSSRSLLLFYKKLFQSPSEVAVKTILSFLADPGKLIGDVELAKLWLARYYYVTNGDPKVEDVLKEILHGSTALKLFKTYPSDDSKIFFKGRPFLLPEEFKNARSLIEEHYGKRDGDALYPATF